MGIDVGMPRYHSWSTGSSSRRIEPDQGQGVWWSPYTLFVEVKTNVASGAE